MAERGDGGPKAEGAIGLDKELIRELAAMLEETGLGEIEVSEGGRSVRVARPGNNAAGEAGTGGQAPGPAAEEDLSAHPGAVLSPMVGTIFIAAEPGAEPFVKTGERVIAGQTLLIVEAMKTMNPIPAPRDGRVARILVSNGVPVEFGDALMILE